MRIRSLLLMAAFAATVTILTGCGRTEVPGTAKPDSSPGGDNPDVGASLYPIKPDVKIPVTRLNAVEPLILPNCQVTFDTRQQLSAEVDGTIELLAVRDDNIDPADPDCVHHPRFRAENKIKYRRLRDGAQVREKELVCQLDSQQWETKLESAQKTEQAMLGVKAAATKGVELSEKKVILTENALAAKSGSQGDLISDQLNLTRFQENLANAIQTYVKAVGDEKEAVVMIRKHQLRSTVNGIVRNISRRQGEFVKAGEKIMEIQSTDTVRVEGNLEIQYAIHVKPGMTVTVEPAVPSAADKAQAMHRTAVTGIAITSHAKRPLVVSTGADGSARVWDVVGTQSGFHLPHSGPVRSVACSPASAKSPVAVTGGDDGIIRVWDLSNPDKLPSEAKVMAESHPSPVGAIAFSPDGRFLATAGGRDVFIWDAVEWKKLYTLPSEHRDVITCLHMTPQGTLITASKDRTMKIWKLGAQQAAVSRTLDHRAGVVDILGVTSDGGRVVFDQDKNRLDLIGLADRQTTGQVQNVGPTAAFATLAVFNQDDTLLLTAGGEGELKGGLQVWNMPKEGGRGAEVARLFTQFRHPVTAAAFSPSSDHRFLAAGDDKGNVHIWSPPSASRQAYTGKVVYFDSVDPRYLTVRVEMDNRKLNLLERSTATVIITPGK